MIGWLCVVYVALVSSYAVFISTAQIYFRAYVLQICVRHHETIMYDGRIFKGIDGDCCHLLTFSVSVDGRYPHSPLYREIEVTRPSPDGEGVVTVGMARGCVDATADDCLHYEWSGFDGCVYIGHKKAPTLLQTYTKGDRVGVMVTRSEIDGSRTLTAYKNGVLVGTICDNIPQEELLTFGVMLGLRSAVRILPNRAPHQ